MGMNKSLKMFPILAMLVVAVAVAVATMEEDEKDCADQLANLAACIPYVSGTAKKPTPQCCQDTQKVKSAKPKCLCVLIKESTDPSMGLPVNTTLALEMPSQCNIDAKISDCPTLLNLSPDSPDAKIFKSGSSTSSTTDAQPTPASASSGTSSSSSGTGSGSDSKATPTSNGVAKMSGSLLVMTGLASLAWVLI